MSKLIEVDEYHLEKLIGKGTYGDVYYTTKKGSNIPYATKRMKRENVENPNYIKYFINEISILKEIYHKNIVRLEALKKTSNNYYIIMDYCNGGTLRDNFNRYKMKYGSSFPEKIIQHIMR
jgi:serine/threonine-protein kinase ULK/ATG1